MIANAVAVAIWLHPRVVALVEVDGRRARVRRLEQRQLLWHPGLDSGRQPTHGVPEIAPFSRVRRVVLDHRESVHGRHIQQSRLRVGGRSRPAGAAADVRALNGALQPIVVAQHRRGEQGAESKIRHRLDRHRPNLRGEIDQIVHRHTLVLEGRRLGRKRLGRRQGLALHVAVGRHRTFLDWPHRVAGRPVEHVGESLFADLRHRLGRPPVGVDVNQGRRGGEVVVPHPVVHRLEVPHALAGLDVERHQAFGKQVVAGPVSPVVVPGRRPDRQIDVPEFVVHTQHGPDVGVARVPPRFVQPGLGAEVVGLRDGPEHPFGVAGPGVHTLEPARGRLFRGRAVGNHAGGDHDVVRDDRRRGDAEAIASVGANAAYGARKPFHQVDAAVVAKVEYRGSGVGIERDQVALVGPEEDARVGDSRSVVGPVGDAARVVEMGRTSAQIGFGIV